MRLVSPQLNYFSFILRAEKALTVTHIYLRPVARVNIQFLKFLREIFPRVFPWHGLQTIRQSISDIEGSGPGLAPVKSRRLADIGPVAASRTVESPE